MKSLLSVPRTLIAGSALAAILIQQLPTIAHATSTPQLTVVKTAQQGTVLPGNQVIYDFVVKNTGGATAVGVSAFDFNISNSNGARIAPVFQFVSSSGASCSFVSSENYFKCPLGDIAAGGTKSFSMTFQVPTSTACGSRIVMNQVDVWTSDKKYANWDKEQVTVVCAQCKDGIDNDSDGKIDFPNDLGCENAQDNDETNASCPNPKNPYASRVIENTPVGGGAPNNLLGPPDNNVVGFDNVGNQPGFVTVGFDTGIQITNGSGDDFIVHVIDFITSEPESFEAFVSSNGTNFFSVGVRNPTQTTANQLAQLGFDINSTGLSSASFVKIVNKKIETHAHEGVDLDTIQVLRVDLCPPTAQCSDGVDNDNDGATDYPADFSCSSADDNDETNPKAQCQDGVDNDNDGKIDFPNDLGCTSKQDNDESNDAPLQCSDPIDSLVAGSTYLLRSHKDGNLAPPLYGMRFGNETFSFNTADGANVKMSYNPSSSIKIDGIVVGGIDNGSSWQSTKSYALHYEIKQGFATVNSTKLTVTSSANSVSNVNCGTLTEIGNPSNSRSFCQKANENGLAFSIEKDYRGETGFFSGFGWLMMPGNSASTQDFLFVLDKKCRPPETEADLSIVKSGAVTTTQGGVLLYTITATNHGPGTATNVTIADPIPSGLTFVPGQSSPECVQNGINILCNNFSLGNGVSKTVTIAFTVPQNAACESEISNKATVSSSSTDPRSGNNQSGTIETTVKCETAKPDLFIEKTGPATAQKGGGVTYTIHAENRGNATAIGTVIADHFPPSLLSFVNVVDIDVQGTPDDISCTLQPVGSPTFVHCIIGNFEPGASVDITLLFEVKDDIACGTIIDNKVDIQEQSIGGSAWSAVQTKVTCDPGSPSLTVDKTVKSYDAQNGTIVYQLVAKNTGNATAQGVVLTEEPGPGLTFVSGTGCPGTFIAHSGVVDCQIGTMAAGASMTFTFTFSVDKGVVCSMGGVITNGVNFKAEGVPYAEDHADQVVSCTGSSSSSSVSSSSSLSSSSSSSSSAGAQQPTVTQTAPGSSAKGGTVKFTITAESGPIPVVGAVVASHFSPGLVFDGNLSTFGCLPYATHVACDLGTLNAPKTVMVAYTIADPATCGGIVTSKALLQGAGGVQSNTDIDTVTVTCGGSSVSSVSSSASSVSSVSSSVSSSSSAVSSSQGSSVLLPQLAVSISDLSSAAKGSTVTYTVTASNPGQAVGGAVVNVHGVSGLTFLPAQSTAGCSLEGDHVHCPIPGGTLSPGNSPQVFTLKFTVGDGLACSSAKTLQAVLAAGGGLFSIDETNLFITCP